VNLELDYIPVDLFTNITNFPHCTSEKLEAQVYSKATRRYVHLRTACRVVLHPEEELEPWKGPDGGDGLQKKNLGSWRIRWYHAQVMINSPFELTVYLDVDAYPCSGGGISRLLWKLHNSNASFGSLVVSEDIGQCQSTSGDCTKPHPPGMRRSEAKAWQKFGERHAGVVVVNMRKCRLLMKSFARAIRRSAGTVTGDQYALREALFMMRKEVPQLVYKDDEVCRYDKQAVCRLKGGGGCAVHHMTKQRSLIKYDLLDAEPGTLR